MARSGVMTVTPSGSRLLRVMLAVSVLAVPVSSVAVAVHVKVSPGEAVSLESARVGPTVPSLHAQFKAGVSPSASVAVAVGEGVVVVGRVGADGDAIHSGRLVEGEGQGLGDEQPVGVGGRDRDDVVSRPQILGDHRGRARGVGPLVENTRLGRSPSSITSSGASSLSATVASNSTGASKGRTAPSSGAVTVRAGRVATVKRVSAVQVAPAESVTVMVTAWVSALRSL